jgi:hypothetical protein
MEGVVMKPMGKHTLAMLAVAITLGTIMLPSLALSSAASTGSADVAGNSSSATVYEPTAVHPDGSGRSSRNPGVVPIQAMIAGKSYGDWSAAWWQWTMSHPITQFDDPTGQFFPLDQSGPVWFLQGGFGSQERWNTMPTGTFLVSPLFIYLNDYPCPDPDFHPAPGQSMEDFLTEGARAIIDGITPPSLEVDGVLIKNPTSYRATSKLFTFTGDLSMQAFDGCVTGSPQVGVSDGYLVILKPLPPGAHTLLFSGFGDIVIHLTVGDGQAAGATTAGGVSTTTRGDVPHTTWGRVKGIYR